MKHPYLKKCKTGFSSHLCRCLHLSQVLKVTFVDSTLVSSWVVLGLVVNNRQEPCRAVLPQQMLRAARAHATFCRIIRHAFKLPFNRRSRKQSHAPTSLHAHHLQAAEFLCAQAHSDPNIWQAALQSPKHFTTVRLSVRAASRDLYELMHSLQDMTIYDLAHPAVNNTAPCWQSQFVSAAPHLFVPRV